MLTPSSRASHSALTSAPNAKSKLGYFLSVSSKKLRQNIPEAGIVYSCPEQQASNDTGVTKTYAPSHLHAGCKESEQQWNSHYSSVYRLRTAFPCMHHFTFTLSREILVQFTASSVGSLCKENSLHILINSKLGYHQARSLGRFPTQ